MTLYMSHSHRNLIYLILPSVIALTSVLLLVSNKLILSTYSFHYPLLMSLSHMTVGLCFLQTLKRSGLIHFAPFEWKLAKRALPVSMCFILNCVLGMVALRGTNIPMFSTLRRLTVLMVMICEGIVFSKRPTNLTVLSVAIMVAGSFIGGWADLQFDLIGYGWVLLNNLVTALNLVFLKKTLSDTQLASDTFGVLYYNSLLSIPFLVVLATISGEIFRVGDFPFLLDPSFQFAFLLSATVSFAMNYSTYWCTEVNSALTTSVTGQVKNVLSSLVSLLLVSSSSSSAAASKMGVGVAATPMLVCGLTVGLSGSFLYAYALAKNQKVVTGVSSLPLLPISITSSTHKPQTPLTATSTLEERREMEIERELVQQQRERFDTAPSESVSSTPLLVPTSIGLSGALSPDRFVISANSEPSSPVAHEHHR